MSADAASKVFESLHPKVQKWIWRQGWNSLRKVQEEAAPTLLSEDSDLIIAAATAGGKTEAAFLPILSRLLGPNESTECDGLVLYISPLKALINDQFQRLELMTEGMEIPVVPWHGDINRKDKQQFLKKSHGILLITPESLESILVNHGHRAARLFQALRYLVVDELHAFIGVERGMQLQSLMHRVEFAIRRRVPRVGLSATLGDMSLAGEFLRPGGSEGVKQVISQEDSGGLKLQIRGYRHRPPAIAPKLAQELEQKGQEPAFEDTIQGDVLDVGRHLFKALRGSNNLIFANSRRDVETYADLLRRECERLNVPVEFFPHHGSLSKDLRQHVESGLKGQSRPISAVCTSTLELGIDIGNVSSIAQIGPPHQVNSMRQRLGRSGRRGEAAVLRIYIQEPEVGDKTPLGDRLHPALFQAVAMTELLLSRWTEPPRIGALHLSTLIQQILSVIAQHGGATARSLWNILCENAPFAAVGRETFVNLLKQMGAEDLLMQSADGTLLHGELGERIVNHYSFYTAFTTPEEFSLAVDGKIIGTLPIDRPISEGSYIIFAGRRWRVLNVDMENNRVDLARSAGGRAPNFGGTPGVVHDVVRAEMFDLYHGSDFPVYLDPDAKTLFEEGRRHFRNLDLNHTAILQDGDNSLLLPWAGDIAMDTLAAMCTHEGIQVEREGICLTARRTEAETLRSLLDRLASSPEPSDRELALEVENKVTEKYHQYLDHALLSLDWGSQRLDTRAAMQLLQRLTSRPDISQVN